MSCIERGLAVALAGVLAGLLTGTTAPGAGVARAQPTPTPTPTQGAIVPQHSGTIAWVKGGVGEEERAAMAAARNDYNLRLTFATRRSGAMRVDVALTIADHAHGQLLALDNAGPQLYVQLPPGTYRIVATAGAEVQRRAVTLGSGGARELYFYWNDDDDGEPAAPE